MSQGSVTRWWLEGLWSGAGAVQHDLLLTVENGWITGLDRPAKVPNDARRVNGLVIPGLANGHSHAFHRVLRSRTQQDKGSFWTWRRLMYEAADRLDPDSYLALATGVYAEMALAGITSVGEFHYLHHAHAGRPYADRNIMGKALVEAAGRAGIRISLLDTCYLSAAPDGSPLTGPQRRFGDGSGDSWAERAELLADEVSRGPWSSTARVGAALHSVRGVPLEHMTPVVAWAAARNSPLHVHSSEQPREIEQCLAAHGRTPTAVLRDAGVLGPRTTSVHSTHLTEADLADLQRTGTGTCFCPTTERDLGDGIGSAERLIAIDAPFSLGSDSHAVIDLFEEARATELNARLATGRRGGIAADRLLRAATADGQRSLGWDDVSLVAVGQRADFVSVDMETVRTAGGIAAPETIVFAASAADVRDVVVAGRHIVSDGHHLLVKSPAAIIASSVRALFDADHG